jgi:hypothetical protein
MAVTILNQPTTPNVTGTSLVYSLSGSEQNEPQFRYITDIYYSGSTDRLTRLFTNKNLYGNTNINVASILGDYLDYDYNWKISNSSSFDNSVKTFNIEFGEQYAASVTGPVTDYSASVSSSIQVFNGYIETLDQRNGFNWNSGSYLLTDSPSTQSFLSTEYLTVPVYNTDVTVKYYQTGSLTATKDYVSAGNFSAIPISPLNIGLYSESDAITLDVTGSSLRFELNTDCNKDEGTRFAFTNKNGFWDYYTTNNPTRRTTNINKSFYEVGFTKLNESVTNYNISDRGNTQYFTDYEDTFNVTTDSLTSEYSQWLRQMLTSTEVYIQSSSNFIPINILNTSEAVSHNTARNKNFELSISYRYSNNREPR